MSGTKRELIRKVNQFNPACLELLQELKVALMMVPHERQDYRDAITYCAREVDPRLERLLENLRGLDGAITGLRQYLVDNKLQIFKVKQRETVKGWLAVAQNYHDQIILGLRELVELAGDIDGCRETRGLIAQILND